MNLHREIHFEVEICEHLGAHGWLVSADDAGYDVARALYPADLFAWVQEAQPKAWDQLVKSHGAAAGETLLARVRAQLDARGTLEVLRQGVELLGLRAPLALAQFKPALAMNEELVARYRANRLRVMRQVHYSSHSRNSLDLVLFCNGLPVATCELKTDFTQRVQDAIDQYRYDRPVREKGGAAEPLLSFPRGALVHFAVSTSEVHMTTRLAGKDTRFLPFNRGDGGGAGNPETGGGAGNPVSGFRTAYLWEQVLEREGWLEILGRYLVARKDDKRNLTAILFPRYHQLDATRKLVAAVLAEGPGGRYLIQHSAGSGKTNSIAWSAHFLSDLHDADLRKLFDSVLVVSDRNVIDHQLQTAIFDFERTVGVVATISGEGGSKSTELAEALSGDKKIVVCTIQTFPYALTAVRELAATRGKRFAVIADEAHSSQTGEAAAKLKAVLSPEELADLGDGGEVSCEDLLAAQMAARADERGITFVAFTATPKAKTLELFGRRPDPTRPAGADNLPAPFHVYSMRQAIEEGFILDVLQNYTSYKVAFKLAQEGGTLDDEGGVLDDREVERGAATKGIMGWVRLHPYNIAQKVEIVVEHFRRFVAPLLGGRAKAMVVVGSRVEAVRWQLAIDRHIRSRNLPFRTLVAFSGEVSDPESGDEPFSERSATLNPHLRGADIRQAFEADEYRILLVANKFQTGFDQPLLCGMYVARRLAGIQAVQTLSRLNRAHPGKDTTYVLDFVNDPDEVLQAFRTYHTTTQLAGVTDPDLVFDLRAKLDAAGCYDDFEVDRVVAVELKEGATQAELAAAVGPVVDRLHRRYRAAQEQVRTADAQQDPGATGAGRAAQAWAAGAAHDELAALQLFKKDMESFQKLYTYLSQIFNYGNPDIEKRAIFFRQVLRLLEFGREREGVDLSKVQLTHYTLRDLGTRRLPLTCGPDAPRLAPVTDVGAGQVQDKQKAYLSTIIAKLNDLFEGDLTDDDRLVYVRDVIKGKLLESPVLRTQAANNTREQFANSPDLKTELLNAIMAALEAHTVMSRQALNSELVRSGLRDVLLDHVGLYEALRGEG